MIDGYVPSGRVVVTGLGAVTALGTGAETFWPRMLSGESAVGPITQVDASPYACQIAAEIRDFRAEDWMDLKEAKRVDRNIAFAAAAGRLAMQDTGIEPDDELREMFGVMIGSGIGGLWTMDEQHRVLLERGAHKVSPFWVPYMIANMASGVVSIQNDLRGPNVAPVTACSTGANAIGDAYHVIKRGDAVMMLAGGSEATINHIGIAGFSAMRAMSTRNHDPKAASRPFDLDRDGFVMGEGSAVLVLEDLEHAKARGAKIYAEIIGYGMSADAYHLTNPHPTGRGAASAMRKAMRSAGIQADQVGYVNAHGTSTPVGDVHEIHAIKDAFGEAAKGLHISSTKSMIGHTLGAAGAIETVVCIMALRDQKIPPTINVENQDPKCDLDVTPNVAKELAFDIAMNNSFGFGGHNVSLLLRRYVA